MCAPVQILCLALVLSVVGGQNNVSNITYSTELHSGLSERIGNFSIEILAYTARKTQHGQNFIVSPITIWTVMAVIGEGASNRTLQQISYALRLTNNKTATWLSFQNLAKWLLVKTPTVELEKFNAIFVDENSIPEKDFLGVAAKYDAVLRVLQFAKAEEAADKINKEISAFTRERIPRIVESSDFSDAKMLLSSAVFFKGQWTSPFNASSTKRMPFYDTNGMEIGEVNMMYNRYKYPFASVKDLQARVIELPYGVENRLSMLIMLPNPGVTFEEMFLKFKITPLDRIFEELRIATEQYGEDEVDCFLPRFKIESNINMNDALKKLGIRDVFDQSKAFLPYMARNPLYVKKIVHKAEIEVTEEGTTASAVTAAEFANRIGTYRFEANHPFCYLIVERVTNVIVFGGIYQSPSLY